MRDTGREWWEFGGWEWSGIWPAGNGASGQRRELTDSGPTQKETTQTGAIRKTNREKKAKKQQQPYLSAALGATAQGRRHEVTRTTKYTWCHLPGG